MHSVDGELHISDYSGRTNEYINSVSRGGLNATLMDKAETYPNLKFYFNSSCTNVDLDKVSLDVIHEKTGEKTSHQADYIFGADGSWVCYSTGIF